MSRHEFEVLPLGVLKPHVNLHIYYCVCRYQMCKQSTESHALPSPPPAQSLHITYNICVQYVYAAHTAYRSSQRLCLTAGGKK